MLINNEGGYLFSDEVINSLLLNFEELTYDDIISEMYKGKFEANQHSERIDSRSIKTAKGVVTHPYFHNFSSITYKGVQINFTCQIVSVYLSVDDYNKALYKQSQRFSD